MEEEIRIKEEKQKEADTSFNAWKQKKMEKLLERQEMLRYDLCEKLQQSRLLWTLVKLHFLNLKGQQYIIAPLEINNATLLTSTGFLRGHPNKGQPLKHGCITYGVFRSLYVQEGKYASDRSPNETTHRATIRS